MSDNRYYDEKQDEKMNEKDEKELDKHEEKTMDEKYRRDPLGTAIWAFVFIWAGAVLLLANSTNILNNLSFLTESARAEMWLSPGWALVFIGAGVIFLAEALIRLLVPSYRRPIFGTVFFAVILIGVGLGGMFDWRFLFPVILIFLGLSILLRRPKS